MQPYRPLEKKYLISLPFLKQSNTCIQSKWQAQNSGKAYLPALALELWSGQICTATTEAASFEQSGLRFLKSQFTDKNSLHYMEPFLSDQTN